MKTLQSGLYLQTQLPVHSTKNLSASGNKIFSAADLWNIEKKKRSKSVRRWNG